MPRPSSDTPLPGAATMQGIGADALLSLRVDMLRFAQVQLRNTETAGQSTLDIESRHRSADPCGISSLRTPGTAQTSI